MLWKRNFRLVSVCLGNGTFPVIYLLIYKLSYIQNKNFLIIIKKKDKKQNFFNCDELTEDTNAQLFVNNDRQNMVSNILKTLKLFKKN